VQLRLSYLLSVISRELLDYEPRVISVETRTSIDIIYIRLSIGLSNDLTLEIREILVGNTVKKYAYYLLRRGETLLGCDNAPHHKLSTFPNHCHTKEGIEPFNGSFQVFIERIKKFLRR